MPRKRQPPPIKLDRAWYKTPIAVVTISLSIVSGIAALLTDFKTIRDFMFPEARELIVRPTSIIYSKQPYRGTKFQGAQDREKLQELDVFVLVNVTKNFASPVNGCNWAGWNGGAPLEFQSEVKQDFTLPFGKFEQNMPVIFVFPPFFLRSGETTIMLSCNGAASKPYVLEQH